MADVGVGSKYHVALAQANASTQAVQSWVGYLLRGRGYQKSESRIFAPRFGSGEQGLTDLDLWKSWEQTDMTGGGFQPVFSDSTKVQMLKNAVYNPVDHLIYPSPTVGVSSVPANTSTLMNQSAVYKGLLYYVIDLVGGAGKGGIATYNASTNVSASIKTDFPTFITGIQVANNLLWVATSNGGLYSYDGTTWTSLGSTGAPVFTKLFRFRGALYGSGSTNNNASGTLYSLTGTPASAGVVSTIGTPGDQLKDILAGVEYNHRLYVGKTDGLYAYDGVQISTILDYSEDESSNNFKYMAVFNGALYFTVKNQLMRYNGSTVEVIQYFANYETVYSIAAAASRLWITTSVVTAVAGKDFTTASANLYYYDGVGIYHYQEATSLSSGIPYHIAFCPDSAGNKLLWFIGQLTGATTCRLTYINIGLEYQQGNITNPLTLYTSEFDGNFPFVDKWWDSVTTIYDGFVSTDTVAVWARTFDGTTWSSWTQTVGGVFKKIQLKIIVTRNGAASNLALKSFTLRWILSPDFKRQWDLTLLCRGRSDNQLVLADGQTTETTTAEALREQIYQCRQSDVPVFFEDIDIHALNGAVNNVVTTLTFFATNAFPNAGLVKIDDEIIRYTGKTATTLTGCTRGQYGTTAASHSNGAQGNVIYRVVLSKINVENVVSPAIVDGVMDSYGNDSEISLTLIEA